MLVPDPKHRAFNCESKRDGELQLSSRDRLSIDGNHNLRVERRTDLVLVQGVFEDVGGRILGGITEFPEIAADVPGASHDLADSQVHHRLEDVTDSMRQIGQRFHGDERQGRLHAEVRVLREGGNIAPVERGLLLPLRGRWQLNDIDCDAGAGLWWDGELQQWHAASLDADAALVAVRLESTTTGSSDN